MPRHVDRTRTLPCVDRVQRLLDDADARGISGWDFGWLDGRMTASGLPWDYPAIVDEWVARSTSVVRNVGWIASPRRAHR